MREDKKKHSQWETGYVTVCREYAVDFSDRGLWAESISLEMTADLMQEVICANDLLPVYRASGGDHKAVVEAAELLRKSGEEELALRLLEGYARSDVLSASGPMAHRVGSWRNGENKYPIFRPWFCHHAVTLWCNEPDLSEKKIIARFNKEANDRNNETWATKESGAEINPIDAAFYEETKDGGPTPETMRGWLYEIRPLAKHPVSRK